MRTLPLLLVLGCGLKQVLPRTAVLSPAEIRSFDGPAPADVRYTGRPRTPALFAPLQVFGLQYAVDIVLVTEHPDWEMHEIARLDTPERSFWIAKDAAQGGVQTIVSDAPNLKSWLPEVPIPRIQAPVTVVDRSEGDDIDLRIAYTNPAGLPVEVWTQAHMPPRPPIKRNGNTMGHSREIVAAVLDLERMGSNVSAGVSIGGEAQTISKIADLIPFKFLLRQTQGGVAIANYGIEASQTGFTLSRPAQNVSDWPTQSSEQWTQDGDTATYDNGICRFVARFIEGGLASYTVYQHGMEQPVFNLALSPALPDLRRTFPGSVSSHFRMDVGGQLGHGTGLIKTEWVGDGIVGVWLLPSEPSWLADRPMEGAVRYSETGEITVQMMRSKPGKRTW